MDRTIAQQTHSVYRTCESCQHWDYARRTYWEDVMVAVCHHRHVQKIFGGTPKISHNFGCIHHSAVPPEVVR